MSMMMQWCGAAARRLMRTQPPPKRLPFSPVAETVSSGSARAEVCGRGDKKTKKGKRFKGSFGNSRTKKKKMIERIKDKIEVPRSTPWPLPFKLI